MRYCEIIDKENEKYKMHGFKPKWYMDDGSRITDEKLIEMNVYPVYDTKPNEERIRQKKFSEWEFNKDHVKITYYIIRHDIPEYDEVFQNVILVEDKDKWTYDGDIIYKKWEVVDKTEEEINNDFNELKNTKLNDLPDYRWKIETGGLLFQKNDENIVKIHTDRESQNKISNVYWSVKNNLIVEPVTWKTKDGFAKLSPEEIELLAPMLLEFVQKCYNIEEQIEKEINNIDNLVDLYNYNIMEKFNYNIDNSILLNNL